MSTRPTANTGLTDTVTVFLEEMTVKHSRTTSVSQQLEISKKRADLGQHEISFNSGLIRVHNSPGMTKTNILEALGVTRNMSRDVEIQFGILEAGVA